MMFSYIPMFGVLVAFKDYNYQLAFSAPLVRAGQLSGIDRVQVNVLGDDQEIR